MSIVKTHVNIRFRDKPQRIASLVEVDIRLRQALVQQGISAINPIDSKFYLAWDDMLMQLGEEGITWKDLLNKLDKSNKLFKSTKLFTHARAVVCWFRDNTIVSFQITKPSPDTTGPGQGEF